MVHPQHSDASEGTVEDTPGPDELRYQQLWFAMASQPWSSLLLVPAGDGVNADDMARRIGAVGKKLSDGPITVVTAGSLDYGTAAALADLPVYLQQVRRGAWPASSPFEMPPSSEKEHDVSRAEDGAVPEGAEPAPYQEALMRLPDPADAGIGSTPGARLVISIPPVIEMPLGLGVAQNADLVVLVVELGRSRIASVKKTLELVGRDRVAGCFVIR